MSPHDPQADAAVRLAPPASTRDEQPGEGAGAAPGSSPVAAESTRGPACLEIRDLEHAYGDHRVLQGLSLRVGRGEILGLLGPNGCGKSTTLQVLTGMAFPQAGELRFEGAPIVPGDRRLRQRVGIVFQSSSVDERLSARENLRLSASLYGMPAERAKERIEHWLRFAQLQERADEVVRQFSGGMRRRLELVRALLHDPSMLLMDEPTAGLDEPSFQRLWERIEELRQRRSLTVLLTTHRPEEAERCDRIAILDRGRIVAEGEPSQLKQQVSGDVLTLRGERIEELAREVTDKLGIQARVVEGEVVIEHDQGHELIPRLVETLGHGRLQSLSMRPPTLADVFLKQTGRSFEEPEEGAHE